MNPRRRLSEAEIEDRASMAERILAIDEAPLPQRALQHPHAYAPYKPRKHSAARQKRSRERTQAALQRLRDAQEKYR